MASTSERHTAQPFKSQASCKWKCFDLLTLPPLTYELCFSSKKLPLLKVRSRLYKLLVAYLPFKKLFHFPHSVYNRSSQKHDTDPDSFLYFAKWSFLPLSLSIVSTHNYSQWVMKEGSKNAFTLPGSSARFLRPAPLIQAQLRLLLSSRFNCNGIFHDS